ncbi:ABC-ATPase domain-containing protein [Aestuariirhabdus sp. Z084]|uniref:ABC-ATPase domain-containing protein n=1 Tax=Aestuariirhabdus haliotis TaxID=2918751 RepID=UPI00201B3AF6|nr:ABC-ATPase domain-containing protein [Aestuariirhabdus haliotis]MCL6415824.1 ABC-ATPase domain-containing protein [Aestuariirhabdus haliotis]MCL6419874.1 ABC-ATPase domain-containing protein [Aestuariirhabdus haliotis]
MNHQQSVSIEQLQQRLTAIDGQGYKAYKRIAGRYVLAEFELSIDHVQGDPFADPSRCSLHIDSSVLPIPQALMVSEAQRTAVEDFLGRRLSWAMNAHRTRVKGSGNSGLIHMAQYGQQVLKRNAVIVRQDCVEIRCQLGLPAHGRRVAAAQACRLICEELPELVANSLLAFDGYRHALEQQVRSVLEQQQLRDQLTERGLVAFVADGSLLPRASGIDDRPLADAVSWQAPETLAVELVLDDGTRVRGLGFRSGVSLIVGGGFHGKSTLLHALERGVYDHIPGDGRERVVTLASAVKIRAEDGRSIRRVDISPFIGELPGGRSTVDFSTDNASGSTSQAANIIEALATSSRCLLLDEDTCATNFMIRDRRMQALVSDDCEPISPLVQRVGSLRGEGVSVILVMGGSGDFFAAADAVVMMDHYRPRDVSVRARQLADPSTIVGRSELPAIGAAATRLRSLSATAIAGPDKVKAFDTRLLRLGHEEIDLSRVEQLVDEGQLLSIGYLLQAYARAVTEAATTTDLVSLLESLWQHTRQQGLDPLPPYVQGRLAMPRLQELAAALNRLRSLQARSG